MVMNLGKEVPLPMVLDTQLLGLKIEQLGPALALDLATLLQKVTFSQYHGDCVDDRYDCWLLHCDRPANMAFHQSLTKPIYSCLRSNAGPPASPVAAKNDEWLVFKRFWA